MSNFPGLGTDLKLDENGDFVVGINGDLAVCEDLECLGQGVIHRLVTPFENLFYDLTYGLDWPRFLHGDSGPLEQAAFRQAIIDQLKREPRIRPGSLDCDVILWEAKKIIFQITFIHIEGTTETNLVLGANLTDAGLVVQGVNFD